MKVKKAGPKFTLLQHRKLYSCALDRPTKAVSRDAMGFRVLEKSCEARCQTRFGLNLAVLAAQISEARCQTRERVTHWKSYSEIFSRDPLPPLRSYMEKLHRRRFYHDGTPLPLKKVTWKSYTNPSDPPSPLRNSWVTFLMSDTFPFPYFSYFPCFPIFSYLSSSSDGLHLQHIFFNFPDFHLHHIFFFFSCFTFDLYIFFKLWILRLSTFTLSHTR